MNEVAELIRQAETVQIVRVQQPRNRLIRETLFYVEKRDGSRCWVNRTEVLLQEEAALIEELAHVLRTSPNPGRSERYRLIMKMLLRNEVPYQSRLTDMLGKGRTEQIYVSL